MTLCELINNFVAEDIAQKNVQELKKNVHLKQLSKYVRGGISKMTKLELIDLIKRLNDYKSETYIVGGKEIHPDDEQIKIIKASLNHNIRVLAGAGSGKTTTIGCRIKHLLDTATTPDKILVLTFNVEARKNLEEMLDQLMGFNVKLEIRTIDSFCNKIKGDFNNGLNEGAYAYSLSELGIIGRKIMEKYGKEIAGQYEYVFFDEFQDVNDDQFRILKNFVANGCKLTVIGDDSQNIYQFRGSDNYYIINFDRIIPKTQTFKITTNYRSTDEIVRLANLSIGFNKEKIQKNMKAKSKERGIIDLTITESSNHEMEELVKKINYYTQELGIQYGEIAILSRITFGLKVIETEFEKIKMPYVALISDQYSNDYKQVIQEDKIVLSTIHKAKGLEWKVVFIIGLRDAFFPNHMNNGLKNIEEERRLFYVGVTRAKKYLHFITNVKEVPLTRFIGEIKNHVRIETKTNRILKNGLFTGNDDDNKKDFYSVTKFIELMSGKRIEEMRNLGLIPNLKMDHVPIFTEPLVFSDQIKQNVFESDYGIFCDYYMTRQLMINNKQKIKDINVEKILLAVNLTDDEKKIYDKYDLKNYFINKKFTIPIQDHEQKNVNDLIARITKKMERAKIDSSGMGDIMKIGISEFFYPPFFMNKLSDEYNAYKDSTKKINATTQSIDPIYYVSLCAKFNDDRRRLVYRDIQDLYKENNEKVLPRIDEYVNMIKENEIVCKLRMNKMYKINKVNVSLGGELDYIDITNNTLCDIKCAEGDFKVEWMIQLLIYYALFKSCPDCCQGLNDPLLYERINIRNIGVINIFTGKYYSAQLPENYDWELLLEFIESILKDDLKGVREKHEIHEPMNDLDHMVPEIPNTMTDCTEAVNNHNHNKNNNQPDDYPEEIYQLDQSTCKYKKGYMVLDVENNCVNLDIIQLAYIVYDDNDNEIKRFNHYVKDRFVDKRAGDITGITTDHLRKYGIPFSQIIKEFLEDLHGVHTICGHNVCTDVAKLKNNMCKFKIQPSYDIFAFVIVHDTINMYRSVGGKNLKLSELYQTLFNKPMENAHDALVDVCRTAECYVELKKMIYLQENPDAYSNDDDAEMMKKICSKSLFKSSKKVIKVPKVQKVPKKQIDEGFTDILNTNFFA